MTAHIPQNPMERISPLSRENILEYAPLYRSVFNSPPWNDGWSEAAAEERLSTFAAAPAFHGMGLTIREEPNGLVLGWGERWVNGWLFHIKEMCIHERFQREGLGATLMQNFEAYLKQFGFLSANLQTGELVPARAFYEGFGYTTLGLVSLHKKFD